MLALFQLHLHSQLNTRLIWIGLRQLQDETKNIQVWIFSGFYNRHYDDVIMGTIASQITSLTIVYSTVYSGADQSTSKPRVTCHLCGEFTGDRWIPRTNGQLRGKCFHLMTSSWDLAVVAIGRVQTVSWNMHFTALLCFVVVRYTLLPTSFRRATSLAMGHILPNISHQNVKKNPSYFSFQLNMLTYIWSALVPGTTIHYLNQWWFIVLRNKLQQWNSKSKYKTDQYPTKSTHSKATFPFLCNYWGVLYLVREALQLTNDYFCKAIQEFGV